MTTDVGFEVLQRDDGTFRVRTNGMGRHGRPEIEMSTVGQTQVDLATDLLSRIVSSVSHRPMYAGQTMHVADGFAVCLQEAEHMPAGFLARAFGAADRTVMRVTDATGGTESAMLCAAARVRARELAHAGDQQAAARILEEALEAAPEDDDTVTGERAQASVELSHIESDADQAMKLLLQGLRASEPMQLAELGATFEELARFDETRIVTLMRHIATVNLGLVNGSSMIDNTVRVVPSPIWQRRDDDLAELGMAMVPGPWLRLYWSGVTRAELESGVLPEIAGDVFSRLATREDGLARLAYLVRETAKTFPANGSDRALASPTAVPPHTFLASAVLAQVARQRTAEMSDAEIMAAFGLNHDANDRRLALDKARRLRVRLAQWSRDGGARSRRI